MIKTDLKAEDFQEFYAHLFESAKSFEFDKKETVLVEGQICKYLYFIEKGMLRTFYYDNKGNDITHWFAKEEMLITVPPSFFSQAPSSFNIEAIEKTSVRAVTHEQLERVLQKEPHLERYFRIIVVEIMIALGQKIVHLLTKSAEERYQEMIEKYPDIFSRANLGHIAGYLGITQQSLSRIRTPRK